MGERIFNYALALANRGWRVFPIAGKAPPYIKEWQNKASTDEAQIRAWWKQWPSANLALATGAGSGVFVVDVDGEAGALSLNDLETIYGKLPETLEVETARGRHLYFEQPVGMRTKTQASGALGINIDIRGDGGYVVAPPSIHPETKRPYKFKNEDILPARAPAWLMDLVSAEAPKPKVSDSHQVPDSIPKNRRNAAMTKIAGQLRRIGMTVEEMTRAMLEINAQRCKPPLEEKEVVVIAQSIGKKDPARCLVDGSVNDAELVSHLLSDIAPKPVSWRWPGYMPYGGIVVWGGDPGHGKSTVAFTVASYFTKGLPLPGDDSGMSYEPQNVIILSAEDSAETTIRPRMELAGADLSRVHVLDPMMSDGKPAMLPSHLVQLSEKLNETKAGLLIIDPLDSFLGEEVDTYKNSDVRRTLAPIQAIAYRTNTIVLIIGHLNKSTTASAMQRFGGSGAFIAAPRVSFLFGNSSEHEGEHIFACLKNNLAKKPDSLRYTIEQEFIKGIGEVSKIKFLGGSTENAEQLVAPVTIDKNGDLGEKEEAKKFLREVLQDCQRPAKEVMREAHDLCGIATLKRAKVELGVQSRRIAGQWYWALKGWDFISPVERDKRQPREPGEEG
jgi:hypothetical protein